MEKKKVVLATYGTRGDIQPLLALALSLGRHGHDVLLAAPPEQVAWIESHGCPSRPLGSDISGWIGRFANVHTIKPLIVFLDFFRQEIRKQFSQLPGIIRDADLALGASLCFGLHSAAAHLDIPYGFVALTPQLLPSSRHPFIAAKSQNLPLWLNRLSWNLARLVDRVNFTAVLNEERRHLGLKPVKDIIGHVLGDHVIVASDSILGGVAPDVRQNTVQTGYFHLDGVDGSGLPEEVDEFLADGPAPVYVGFGSMSTGDEQALVSLILKSLRSVGQRGILAGFRFDLNGLTAAKDCIFVKETNHRSLFPRVAAVVHHGGSGTTAAASRAGVPQVIVPHVLDQHYWGERVYRCGLGPRAIRRSRLTSGRLAKAVYECVSDGKYRRRSAVAAQNIQKQNSLNSAVEFIEKTFF